MSRRSRSRRRGHSGGDRSRSRRHEGSRRRRREEKDEFNPTPAPGWTPYGGYAYPANYWDYAAAAQPHEDEKKKKKKKKKRGSSSSSSSSSRDAATQWAEMWRSWQGAAGASQAPSGNMGMPAWPPPGPMAWGQWAPGMPSPAWPPGGENRGSMGSDEGWAVAERDEEEKPPEDVPIFLEPSVEDEVAVPKALLGKVIGKQAATIIEIREKSGAFKVDARDQTADPCMVKVAGTAEAVKKAKELILELIDQTKSKHQSSHYVEIPRSKIGMVIGLKGAQVNEVQQQTNTKIDVDFDTDPCKCYIKGDADNVDRAKKVLLTIAMQLEDEHSEYLDLPKTVSGALIGAQGARIRQFQETSGARIDIDKSGSRCKVRLTGSQEAITIAKSLIQAELDKNMTPTKTPGAAALTSGVSHGQMAVPAHQPTSFPATLSESIARARAAAEAVKHGLIPTTPEPPTPMTPVPPPPRPPAPPAPGIPKGGWGGNQWGQGNW